MHDVCSRSVIVYDQYLNSMRPQVWTALGPHQESLVYPNLTFSVTAPADNISTAAYDLTGMILMNALAPLGETPEAFQVDVIR